MTVRKTPLIALCVVQIVFISGLFVPQPVTASEEKLCESVEHQEHQKNTPISGEDIPVWQVGDNWTYSQTLRVAIGSDWLELDENFTYTVAELTSYFYNGTTYYGYNLTLSGKISGGRGKILQFKVLGAHGTISGYKFFRITDLGVVADHWYRDAKITVSGIGEALVGLDYTFFTAPVVEEFDFPLHDGEQFSGSAVRQSVGCVYYEAAGRTGSYSLNLTEPFEDTVTVEPIQTVDVKAGTFRSWPFSHNLSREVSWIRQWYNSTVGYVIKEVWKNVSIASGGIDITLSWTRELQNYTRFQPSERLTERIEPSSAYPKERVWVNGTLSTGGRKNITLIFPDRPEAELSYTTETDENGNYSLSIEVPYLSDNTPTTYDYGSHGLLAYVEAQPEIYTVATLTVLLLPTILKTEPFNLETNVRLSANITVRFNKPMKPETVLYRCTPENGIVFIPHWSENNTVVSYPHESDFRSCVTYTFEITAGEDSEGHALVSGTVPNPWSFTTEDRLQPFIVSVYPAHNATRVALNSSIKIGFSEPMARTSVVLEIYPFVELVPAWSMDNLAVSYSPRDNFTDSTFYTVEVVAATDIAGNTLTSDPVPTRWYFRTVDLTPPVANAGDDHTITAGMSVEFDASGSWDNLGIVNYTWEFYDEHPRVLYGRVVTYTFWRAGDYEVTLNITDADGNWATDKMWVHVLSQTCRLVGRITDRFTHAPVFEAFVVLYGTDLYAKSNQSGWYEIESVPYGTYTLLACKPGYEDYSAVIELLTHHHTYNISIKPALIGWAAGRVLDSTGSPIDGAVVLVSPGGYNTTTDCTGKFNLTLPTGRYELFVSKPGFKIFVCTINITTWNETQLEITLYPPAQPPVKERFPALAAGIGVAIALLLCVFTAIYVVRKQPRKKRKKERVSRSR